MFATLNQDLVIKGKFYDKENLPSQISNAIYSFGSFDVFEILAFIDISDELDGSKGMIITPEAIYFKFGQAGCFKYQDIIALSLEKHRHDPVIKAVIKTNDKNYAFSNKTIDPEIFVNLLSKITDLDIEMIMTNHEKVAYYVPIVLQDLENDEYEDIELTLIQKNKIQEFYQDLSMIEQLDDENYQYELVNLCHQALAFFDDLGLDSDEIDELEKVEAVFNQADLEEEQKIENAKKFYDDMMDKYHYIGLKYLWYQHSILDQRLLYELFPEELLPFDYEAYFCNPARFEMVTTNCLTGLPCYLEEKKDKQRLLAIVKASSSLPYVCPVTYVDGVPMLDGGIIDSIPVARAISQGYEKNLLVLTRNKGYRKKSQDIRVPRFIYRRYPRLRYVLSKRCEVYNAQLELVEKLEEEGRVIVIRPENPVTVNRIEKDAQKLRLLYDEGMRCAEKVIRKYV